MRNKIWAILSVVLLLGAVSVVHAAIPALTLSYTGTGDNVLVNVTGDSNSSVYLRYNNNTSAPQPISSLIGTTNSAGILSAQLSTANYGITAANNLVQVSVNGQISTSVTWPYVLTATASTMTLSQTSAALSIGQTFIITASGNGSNSLYLSNNSSPAVANISINGSQATILANTAGSTSISVCAVGDSSNCASFSVTVQGAAQAILFSQNNLSITAGQTVPVTVAGGTGTYLVTGNTNPNVIQTTVNGPSINFYANAPVGSASITVCSSDMSACGVVNATAVSVTNSSVISFSQNNPVVILGQASSLSVSGGTGNYYVSSNSAPTVVQTNIVGSTITLSGNAIGTATINVCASSGSCGLLVATVNTSTGGTLALSQSNIALSVGQASTIAISGASGTYSILNNSNQSVVSAIISGSNVAVSALTPGTANITVCQSGGQCGVLYVTVSNSSVASNSSIILSQALAVGQSTNLSISGGSTPYYLSSNAGNIFGAVLSGNTLTLSGVATGSSSINVCSSGGTCVPVYVVVGGGSSNASTAASQTTAESITAQIQALQNQIAQAQSQSGNTVANSYKFLSPLKLGDKNADVTELQKRLTAEGVYSGPANGSFGPLTEAAVKKYQTKHGLTPLGNVGPGTRASLNGQ